MIKSLSIENFRSHIKSHLDFHPGINIIVGKSRSGKTNILRALQWLIFYRPTGDSIKNNNSATKVVSEVNNHTVELLKNNKAVYTVDGNQLSGFGTTVPKEVSSSLNISDINIQDQIEEHFLITGSPGEVAKTINKIIQIEQSDSYITSLTTKINSQNQKIKILETKNKEIEKSLNELSFVDKLKSMIDLWTLLSKGQKELELKIAEIQSINNAITDITRDCNVLEKVISSIDKKIKDSKIIFNEYMSVEMKIDLLYQFINLKEMTIDISSVQNMVDKYSIAIIKLKEILLSIKNIEYIESLYSSAIKKDTKLLEKINLAKKEMKRDIDEYVLILSKSGKCPVCYNKIGKEYSLTLKSYLTKRYL